MAITGDLHDVEDADVEVGLDIMCKGLQKYAERVDQGYKPRRLLVSSRYHEAVRRAVLKVQGRNGEPYWLRISDEYRLQIVFSPDLADVYVPIEVDDL